MRYHGEALAEEREREVARLLGTCSCTAPGADKGCLDMRGVTEPSPFEADHHHPDCHLGGWPAFNARWPRKVVPEKYTGGERAAHRLFTKVPSRRVVELEAVTEGLEEWLEARAEQGFTAPRRDSRGRFLRRVAS